jgi:hypothetical protein
MIIFRVQDILDDISQYFFGSLSPNLEVHRSSHGKLFFYDQVTHQTSYTDPRLTYVRESEDVNGELVAISSSQAGIRAGGAVRSWTEWSSSSGLRSLPSIVSSAQKTIKDTEMTYGTEKQCGQNRLDRRSVRHTMTEVVVVAKLCSWRLIGASNVCSHECLA